MAKELKSYRDNLERIKEAFPDKEILTSGEVIKFTGLSRPTVRKLFTLDNNFISVATLAREMSTL